MKNMITAQRILVATTCLCLLFDCPKSNGNNFAPAIMQNSLKKDNADCMGTGLFQFQVEWPVTIPVVCGGETIDHLIAINFNSKTIDHFKDGNFKWENLKIPQIAFLSQKDGESFVPTGMSQKVSAERGLFYVFYNFQGSRGTHYIAHITADSNGNVLEARSVCR